MWVSDPVAHALSKCLASPAIVHTREEFLDAPRDARTISFVDSSTLNTLDRFANELSTTTEVPPPEWRKIVAAVSIGHVIAVCTESLEHGVAWLPRHPWLSHVISMQSLTAPDAQRHVGDVIQTLIANTAPRLLDWIGPEVEGRRIRLTHASRCPQRIDKMTEFFDGRKIPKQTVEQIRMVSRELLNNAFYDAPVAAGALKKPLSPTQDVALPDDNACDLAYGCRDDLAIVRVLDPFGSLSRRRLIEVLTRRASEPDADAGGGIGTGLWRVFTTAAFVAVSVVQYHHTEILVGIRHAPEDRKPFALHLFFKESGKRVFWKLAEESTGRPSMNTSVVLTK